MLLTLCSARASTLCSGIGGSAFEICVKVSCKHFEDTDGEFFSSDGGSVFLKFD